MFQMSRCVQHLADWQALSGFPPDVSPFSFHVDTAGTWIPLDMTACMKSLVEKYLLALKHHPVTSRRQDVGFRLRHIRVG